MALSDSCSDTLHSLAKNLVWYSDWEYSVEEQNKIIEAMFNLSSFTTKQDAYPFRHLEGRELFEISDSYVVQSILNAIAYLVEEYKDESLVVFNTDASINNLIKLAKNNKRLASAIDYLKNDYLLNPNSYTYFDGKIYLELA